MPFLIAGQYLFLATVEGIVKTDTVFLLISGRWGSPYMLDVEVQMAIC